MNRTCLALAIVDASLFSVAAAAAESIPPIHVDISGPSRSSDSLLFALREEFRRSTVVTLTDATGQGYRLHVVVLDGNGPAVGLVTYAAVLTYASPESALPTVLLERYETALVGYCGEEKTESCAHSIYQGVGSDIDEARQLMARIFSAIPKSPSKR